MKSKKAKPVIHKCVECGKRISAARVKAALARGKQPLYESRRCMERVAARKSYAKRVNAVKAATTVTMAKAVSSGVIEKM